MGLVEITNHAYKQCKKRLKLKKESVNKLAVKAFTEGMTHKEAKGSLSRYLSSLYFKERTANNIKLLHDYVFIFRDNMLITVYILPPKFRERCI